jgi:hypothetical protein
LTNKKEAGFGLLLFFFYLSVDSGISPIFSLVKLSLSSIEAISALEGISNVLKERKSIGLEYPFTARIIHQ